MSKPKPDLQAKIDELNAWVDGPFKDYLQELLDKAQRRTRIKLRFWQGMGCTFFDFNSENEYRRPGDPRTFMEMLERASNRRDDPLWETYPELLEFLEMVYQLDDLLPNWIVGDMEPTTKPKS